jgi:hypothetical protein
MAMMTMTTMTRMMMKKIDQNDIKDIDEKYNLVLNDGECIYLLSESGSHIRVDKRIYNMMIEGKMINV